MKNAPALAIAVALLCCLVLPCAANAAVNGGSDVMGCSTGPARTWYFAEGTTRPGFTEYLCVLNPGANAATAEFAYMPAGGATIERSYHLAPFSRTTVRVNDEVPAGSDVSIRIDSSRPVVAERPMYFRYKGAWDGGHAVVGVSAPASEWYFAEGTTRAGFDSYLCLQNPGRTDALVRLDYFLGDGTTRTRRNIRVGAASRFTVAVHEEPLGIGRHDDESGDFSVKVSTAGETPLVAERAMYFNYKPYLTGGHDVFGATAPRADWFFAEGTTRPGFDTYLCISNPGGVDAKVNVSYYCGDGRQVEKSGLAVKPGSRLTVPAHEEPLGIGRHDDAHGDFSARVRSTNGAPIVVERPSYFFYRPFWSGGHDVMGAESPMPEWYFAEGCTRQGFDTYLCLANPSGNKAVVNISYYRGDNQVEAREGIEVEAKSRRTVAVHEVAEGIGRRDDGGGDVSVKVSSANGVPVVAERPMYFAGRWRTMDRAAIAGAWGWGDRTRGSGRRPEVAITIDCENNANADRLMDILQQKGFPATFFLLDQIVTSQPLVVTRMAFDGHEIGNHGVTHSQFTRLSASQVVWELETVESHVNALTGFTTRPYFRFPYGERSSGLVSQVNGLGYFSMYWSVDPQEWRDSNTVGAVVNNVVSTSGPGAIILMHDSAKTIAALPSIIDGLVARGLKPVTLTELMFPGP